MSSSEIFLRDRLLVLAGGFGTRLKPVVADVPKAMAPVCGKPFLHFQIENWIGQGLHSFVFLLHHQADFVIDFLERERVGVLKHCEVSWVVEPAPMGTGGAIANAVKSLKITGDFLTVNADTWLGAGMDIVYSAASPAIGIANVQDSSRYGTVDFGENQIVKAFREKKSVAEPGWINVGLYRLNAQLFKNWNHEPFSLESVSLPAWSERGYLKAVPLTTDFLDMGVPSDYFRLCQWMETKRAGIL
jgi:D-glycero-alpha-D-manno-heptose 1-phosphate guanylyltransferase